MGIAIWAALAVWCEVACLGRLLDPWPSPDLLLVVLLVRTAGMTPARAALSGGVCGLLRDLVSTVRPGTFALTYLVCGLVLAELDHQVRLSGPGGRAALAASLAFLASSLASVIATSAEPEASLVFVAPGAFAGALLTGALAAVMGGSGAPARGSAARWH